MPTDASFRFSTYLALALACAVLGYAEYPMLPEVGVFAALAVVGLGTLYFLESRVEFLSIPSANRLGMAIGLLYMMWGAYRIKREVDTGEFANMGWPMLIVAMCGPLVMLAIVAKVARGEKHAGDYWELHGAALAGVGLAAAFAEEPACFVLVGLYLVAAVWSLTLLHLGRARGAIPPIPGGRQPATKTIPVVADPTGHRMDLRPAILWAVVAVAGAVPLYLITPRSSAAKADFGKPRIEIGYAADQMVDLNRTGSLNTNTAPAFEVTATYLDGSPKTDLSTEQRWRGKALRHYSFGEWKPTDGLLPHIKTTALSAPTWAPPELGPDQFTLSFVVPVQLRSSFVADPVVWVPNRAVPLAFTVDAGWRGWTPLQDGTFFWEPIGRTRGSWRRYVQAYRVTDDPEAGPRFQFAERGYETGLTPLRHNPVKSVEGYTNTILDDLVRAGKLPADFREERTMRPKLEYQNLVARKLTAHLATTPTLRYTTDLKRENKAVDPIEDFLFHTKAGHCERFATALVLMLRSQGIPAIFVLGFKGCEHLDNGRYVVRQEHAHAWVEALLPAPDQPPTKDSLARVYQWRTLDPTPGGDQPGNDDAQSWLGLANTWFGAWFREYITDYSPEQRQQALADLADRVFRPQTLLWLAGAIGLALGLRYLRRQARRAAPVEPLSGPARWFGELVALLAAHGIVTQPGETPLELARGAAATLRTRPTCAAVAEVPLAWAEAYYEDRFGGVTLTADRRAELEAGLAALRRALET